MDRAIRMRSGMTLIGAAAGLAFYGLNDLSENGVLGERAVLVLTVFGAVFFNALLTLAGPVSLRRAAVAAPFLAGLVGLMALTVSYRFADVGELIRSGFPILMTLLLATLPLPFIVAANGPGFRHYPTLFVQSWTMSVRFCAAFLFAALVAGLLALSHELLQIVGITVIADLMEIDPVPWVLAGAIIGLSMGVVTEYSDYLSPYLILRLLRLLLPVVLVVMALFVLALPVQGLSGLFGSLSVAATLLVMAAIAATLVTVAVDQDESDAVAGPLMSRATQALALLVPVFAGLAGYAILERVQQYGLTPARVFAAVAAVLCLGYGVGYLWSVLGRARWHARLRATNTVMALCLIGTALLLMSLVNAEAISARNQIARYENELTAPGEVDVSEIRRWGKAGAEAIETLKTIAQSRSDAKTIAALQAPISSPGSTPPDELRAALLREMPLRPENAQDIAKQLVAGMPEWTLFNTLQSCRGLSPEGTPGCVLVMGDFLTEDPALEGMLFTLENEVLRIASYANQNGRYQLGSTGLISGKWPKVEDGQRMIARLIAGEDLFRPVPKQMLDFGTNAFEMVR